MDRECKRQSGFTLVEVLVAMAVLTIGILGVFAMQIASVGGGNLAVRTTKSATWAGDQLETLMALSYTNAALTDNPTGANVAGVGSAGLDDTDAAGRLADGGPVTPLVGGLPGDYTIFWNVADNYPIFGCKTIRVIARRSDLGFSRIVTLDFIRMEPI